MMRTMLRAKLHRLTVTETNVNYQGSITIDKELLKAADIIVGEKVHVVNVDNGNRFETYAIEGKSGEVCLNGAAARLATPGDRIIVIAYGILADEDAKKLTPKIVFVDEKNRRK